MGPLVLLNTTWEDSLVSFPYSLEPKPEDEIKDSDPVSNDKNGKERKKKYIKVRLEGESATAWRPFLSSLCQNSGPKPGDLSNLLHLLAEGYFPPGREQGMSLKPRVHPWQLEL